jgi:uncharacterized protein
MSITMPYRQASAVSRPIKSATIDVTPKGELSAYLTIYNDPDGSPHVDSYNDTIAPGFMTKTIQKLEQTRRYKNAEYLCPDLWQHESHNPIGGVKTLQEDSQGVYYVTQLNMFLRQAQECAELVKQGILGTSYGYDVVRYQMMGGNNNRALLEVDLWEVSQVTFAANDLVGMGTIDIKQDSIFGLYPSSDRFARRLMETGPQRYTQHIEEQHARHVHAISELDRQAQRFFKTAEPSPTETSLDRMDRTIRRLKAGY